jgi:hypothetical protein
MSDKNPPDITLAVDNTSEEEVPHVFAQSHLQGHKFSGKALLDAVDIIDKGSQEAFPANDLKDVGMKLSILGMAESHVKRLGRLDRAMNMIEQQLATPDRLAQMQSSELAKLYRLLGSSMEVSQKYVKESMWSVNIGELQEQLIDLVAGANTVAGDDSDHSTREVVVDIFRRVSSLGQSFPNVQSDAIPEVNPEHLPSDLMQEEEREIAEQHRQDSHQAMVDEARADHQRANGGSPVKPPARKVRPKDKSNDNDLVGNDSGFETAIKAKEVDLPTNNTPTFDDDMLNSQDDEGFGHACAGLSKEEWADVVEEELGESAPLDLGELAKSVAGDDVNAKSSADAWNDEEDIDPEDDPTSDWGSDALGGKDDPLADINLDF